MSDSFLSSDGQYTSQPEADDKVDLRAEFSKLQQAYADLQEELSSLSQKLNGLTGQLASKSFDLEASRKSAHQTLLHLQFVQEELERYYHLNQRMNQLIVAERDLNIRLQRMVISLRK